MVIVIVVVVVVVVVIITTIIITGRRGSHQSTEVTALFPWTVTFPLEFVTSTYPVRIPSRADHNPAWFGVGGALRAPQSRFVPVTHSDTSTRARWPSRRWGRRLGVVSRGGLQAAPRGCPRGEGRGRSEVGSGGAGGSTSGLRGILTWLACVRLPLLRWKRVRNVGREVDAQWKVASGRARPRPRSSGRRKRRLHLHSGE
jgi:hypothetical protein